MDICRNSPHDWQPVSSEYLYEISKTAPSRRAERSAHLVLPTPAAFSAVSLKCGSKGGRCN